MEIVMEATPINSEITPLVYSQESTRYSAAPIHLTNKHAYGVVAIALTWIVLGIAFAKCNSCNEGVHTAGKAVFVLGMALLVTVIASAAIIKLKKRG